MILPLLPVAGLAIAGVAKVVGGAAALAAQAGSAALATGKQAASSVMSGGKDVTNAAGKAAKDAAENPEATGKKIVKGVATDALENAASNVLTSNRSKEEPQNQDGQERSNLQQNDSQQNNERKLPLHAEKLDEYQKMCKHFLINSKQRCKELTTNASQNSETLSQTSRYSRPERP